MFRAFLLILGLFVSQSFVQADAPKTDAPPPPPAKSPNVVGGLELPADQVVDVGEGFVNVVAKCKGDVKWLVVSPTKVKYLSYPQSIVVSIPNSPGQVIHVFGVGMVDGKMTEFAATNITIKPNATAPAPAPPSPSTPAAPTAAKAHLTLVVDLSSVTQEMATLLNSESLKKSVTDRGVWFRLYDIRSPVIAQKKLDAVVQRIGGNAVMVLQDNDGAVLYSGVLPNTEAEIMNVLNRFSR